MGTSQSRPDLGLNTRGQIIKGAILTALPIGGTMLTPIFEKIASWLNIFQKKPMPLNNSMQEIRASIDADARQRSEVASATQQAQAAAAAAVAKARKGEAAAARRREEAAASATQQAQAAAAAAAAKAREGEAAATRRREEAAASATELTEARKQEAVAKSHADAATKEARRANAALQQGIRPVVMPTDDQYQAALKRMQYNEEKFHFAVCGTSGSGKSSLINAFRGLSRQDTKAAAVGVTETTSRITRYPDPRSELPCSRFVWYDIPGAGTTAVSDWQYFNDQGLFVFDFIVMVYDVRFTAIDVSIIENCYRFNIPVFVVRSKADQHIDNMMKELELDSTPGSDEYKEIYQDIKAKYVDVTKSDFDKHIKNLAGNPDFDARDQQMLLSQRLYIVSAIDVRAVVRTGDKVDKNKLIDEYSLVEELIKTAARRRYSEDECQGVIMRGREAGTGASSQMWINPGSSSGAAASGSSNHKH